MTLNVDGTPVELTAEDLEVRTEEKAWFCCRNGPDHYVILDTNLTPALVQEGLAREIVSKVQNMRKNAQFGIGSDRIKIAYFAENAVREAIEALKIIFLRKSLAVTLEERTEKTAEMEEWEINGYPTGLAVEKV